MRFVSRFFVSADVRVGIPLRDPKGKRWCGPAPVTPEESAALFRRQMASSKVMLELGKRIDVRGATEIAERGTEEFPRRDGRIIEPLRHHQRHSQAGATFLPAPRLATETDS